MYSTDLLHYRSNRHRPGQIRCLPDFISPHASTLFVIYVTLFYTLNKLHPL